MDDFAHLLLGYIIFRFMKLAGWKAGRLELAALLVGSVLPDALWAPGLVSYEAAHTATWYILLALPPLLFARTRLAAACFGASAFAHIFVDAFMHERTTVLFAPFLDFSITGAFDYWKVWWAIPAYYLVLFVLFGVSAHLEKRVGGKVTWLIPA